MLMFGKALLYSIYWVLMIAGLIFIVLSFLDWLGAIAISSQIVLGVFAISIPFGLIGGFTKYGRKIARSLMDFFGDLSSFTSGW